jgi:sulfite exporter TauE/SafE
MFIFGISTIPALFSLGFFTQLLNRGSLRKLMMNMASIIVILFGIYTIYRGYDFIENPNKSVLNCCEAEQEDINNSKNRGTPFQKNLESI